MLRGCADVLRGCADVLHGCIGADNLLNSARLQFCAVVMSLGCVDVLLHSARLQFCAVDPLRNCT
jgi:hypothetical protein